MFTLFLQHSNYLEGQPKIALPFMPNSNDWLEIPVDVRQNFWPGCAETLYIVEREHLFDEKMQYYGTRLYLQDWEGR